MGDRVLQPVQLETLTVDIRLTPDFFIEPSPSGVLVSSFRERRATTARHSPTLPLTVRRI